MLFSFLESSASTNWPRGIAVWFISLSYGQRITSEDDRSPRDVSVCVYNALFEAELVHLNVSFPRESKILHTGQRVWIFRSFVEHFTVMELSFEQISLNYLSPPLIFLVRHWRTQCCGNSGQLWKSNIWKGLKKQFTTQYNWSLRSLLFLKFVLCGHTAL